MTTNNPASKTTKTKAAAKTTTKKATTKVTAKKKVHQGQGQVIGS